MAAQRGLTYVKLDGDIGVFGNGAGLVMSTLDVVTQAGGAPANADGFPRKSTTPFSARAVVFGFFFAATFFAAAAFL